ncbi:MAG: 2-oxoglutarate ferredoxin oxidoreductase subunit alpha [Ignavibacteria bacterium RIFOXYB2_FULL_35_12]|nr:MAG: 2-oxoglutarate ferredoxin oxidoreductase subunit alpha [Ignavibacteria bacterium GWC2_35_8]OGU56145.1 MAG: 2-oxoglutarate ferredoxin oxidoreductase subunit alpha [Ignavibacteria bacterium GWF2_35_20]OGU84491.1 MAG: 2-oxoglutarate ferredoxin oxidoreductase subunit alpha [Ignavibacteria bacterium RIFOXYA12_FULL_35_25]OGU92017.1 MAG: 2-oxoglutarate ferredoxin oxidoreductase subunit alpha [Ignavibacteria bacterium RIFOXYC12_FULL_35_11]OGU97971.1 MAG: 2-oxoglutarate ferredoxin oxidoreductase
MSKQKEVKPLSEVTVRFAGDSGDGMQLTGSQFTETTAALGTDVSTLPDFPAEIRAPAGSLAGVSGFQLHFSSTDIQTPGDSPDVLVAMNPAALKVNMRDLKPHATIIANSSAFDVKNLKLANYDGNPLEDGSLAAYNVVPVDLTQLTMTALKDLTLSIKEKEKCKNFFALGLMYWIYNRPLELSLNWLESKFAKKPEVLEANKRALIAGYNYGDTTEIFTTRYDVKPAKLEKGIYRNVSGNEAVALGFIAASLRSGLNLFLGSYPITPASEILQELSKYKNFGVVTFQAEDEISGIASAIGASFAGSLAITTTSGPGLSLKTEALGLAVMTELPLVVVDVQRGGPSTGLPTKTEQADLFQAMYGRHGEAPVVVLSAQSPADCFFMSVEAAKIAVKYMTPVILLTDGYLAFGSEPLKIPELNELPEIPVHFRKEVDGFHPYTRDENLARPWAIPGTPGLEHRIGGLEKKDVYGNISYEPDNHQIMVNKRKEKIDNVQKDVPDLMVEGDQEGELLLLGWGSTYGAIKEAIRHIQAQGFNASQAHLRYIHPFPQNLGDVLSRFKKVLLPELNMGQMATVIRSTFLRDIVQFNKVQGQAFKVAEIENKIIEVLGGHNGN